MNQSISWLCFLKMPWQQSYTQWEHKTVVVWGFQSILNLPRAWIHKKTVLLMNSFSNQKRTECMSGLNPINLWGSILKYLLQNKGTVFCCNTARKRNIRMFSPDQVSQELSSISWRLFLWHSRRDSKKKMVTFYEAHKNITWKLIKVLIKHSDTITPAPHNSMVFPRAKKQTERLPK